MRVLKLKIGKGKLNRSRSGNFFIFAILFITSAFMAFPFVYVISQSIKPLEEQFVFPPTLIVKNPTFENFRLLLQLTNNLWIPFERYLFNSLFITLTGTVVYVVIASMAAFPLAKVKFPGSKVMFEMVVLALLFSSPVTKVAQYVIIAKTNIINTYWALLLPALSLPIGLFLMRQFMVQMIPNAVLEAAKIDGANMFKTFWLVVMPMVRPAWLTLIIFTFVGLWRGDGSEFVYSESLKVLPTVLSQIAGAGMARANVGSAAAVFMLIPPVITFLLVQSNVLQTMAHSGIKE
ncbi:carbohydrate ABC transporter permease [Paenibacillus alkalitolerans]|uniref:carbohydrate ABC transporter permease n=1 Tax=Paenibacillus alkalitolerans TaxID=2799335 RepID=UPI0018F58408|nr:carbohydrate ABC transporter permease [Paenibacillus alkalitolerans]